jgi:hypothetical protein
MASSSTRLGASCPPSPLSWRSLHNRGRLRRVINSSILQTLLMLTFTTSQTSKHVRLILTALHQVLLVPVGHICAGETLVSSPPDISRFVPDIADFLRAGHKPLVHQRSKIASSRLLGSSIGIILGSPNEQICAEQGAPPAFPRVCSSLPRVTVCHVQQHPEVIKGQLFLELQS